MRAPASTGSRGRRRPWCTVARPSRIHRWRRAREYSGASAASTTSNRLPASSSGTVNRVGGSGTLSAMKRHAVLSVVFAILLAACAGRGDSGDPTRNWSEAELYREAKEALDEGDFETAIDYYGKLGARFPFGDYAEQGQLDLVYAYYRFKEPESALEEADRFIEFNPRHPEVAYRPVCQGAGELQPPTRVARPVASNRPGGARHERARGLLRRFRNPGRGVSRLALCARFEEADDRSPGDPRAARAGGGEVLRGAGGLGGRGETGRERGKPLPELSFRGARPSRSWSGHTERWASTDWLPTRVACSRPTFRTVPARASRASR